MLLDFLPLRREQRSSIYIMDEMAHPNVSIVQRLHNNYDIDFIMYALCHILGLYVCMKMLLGCQH